LAENRQKPEGLSCAFAGSKESWMAKEAPKDAAGSEQAGGLLSYDRVNGTSIFLDLAEISGRERSPERNGPLKDRRLRYPLLKA
jgi:hypothetical protein